MIKAIQVINYKNEKLRIDLFSSSDSGMNIRNITGLGPVKANIITTPIITGDGDIYNSGRADKRNVVITIGFVITREIGLKSIEDVRQKTYKYFPLYSLVKLIIETDNRTLYTYGYVESNEPNIWSNDETTTISLICPDSYLVSEEEKNVSIDQLKKVFKFPFEVLETDLESINMMEDGHEESKIIVNESNNNNLHNGNLQFGLYEYDTLYYGLTNDQILYSDLNELTYAKILNKLN